MIRDMHPETEPQRTDDAAKVSQEARRLGYEPRDWPAGRIGKWAPLFALAIAVSMALVWLLTGWVTPRGRLASAERAEQLFTAPGPRLERHPAADLAAHDRAIARRMDRAPVPIDEAMRRVERAGWKDPAP